MTTEEVAKQYYEWAQKGNWQDIQEKLYAQNAVSIEPEHSLWPITKGMEAILEKGKKWNENIEEMHGGYCNEPTVAGKHFSCGMGMDITTKDQGRWQMDEVCVFEVENGKIVKEQFFY